MFRKSVRKFLNEEAYPFYKEWEKAVDSPFILAQAVKARVFVSVGR